MPVLFEGYVEREPNRFVIGEVLFLCNKNPLARSLLPWEVSTDARGLMDGPSVQQPRILWGLLAEGGLGCHRLSGSVTDLFYFPALSRGRLRIYPNSNALLWSPEGYHRDRPRPESPWFRLRHRAGWSEAIIAPIIWSDDFSWLVTGVGYRRFQPDFNGRCVVEQFALAMQRTKEQNTVGILLLVL